MKYLIVVITLASSDILSMENPDHLFADAVKIAETGEEESPREPSPEIVQRHETKSPIPSPTQAVQDDSAQRVVSSDAKPTQKKSHWYQGFSRCFRRR